ncbi:MAG: hypothetical protein E7657_04965 [Ruminococcaceae bacterium]|nr:hypothetical protein [Oscillospiraceae bacterium]
MKKRFFALVMVFALLLSTLMLTSCPNKGDLNLDESYGDNKGSSDVYIVSDPTDPEAGASAEQNYIGDHKE